MVCGMNDVDVMVVEKRFIKFCQFLPEVQNDFRLLSIRFF